MTPSVAAPGTQRSRPSGNGSATSTLSAHSSPTSLTHPPQQSPSLPVAPSNDGASSLYALGIQAQDIASEIALAAELLATDDPDQESSAVRLIEQHLGAQEHTAGLITSKADNICRYRDHLIAMADFRKEQAKRLKELADADYKRAQSLQDYMMKVLTTLYPEQGKFSLPTHELRSRRSSGVVIEDESALPDEFLISKTTYQPDKAAIKEAIKAGASIPGAHIEERISWSIN
jgi:hypothetical protein